VAAIVDGVSYSLRVSCRQLADIATEAGGTLACFRLEVETVTGDEAPYARLQSGVRFRLLEPESTVRRWREVRHALRRVLGQQ
jgi:hypothetical protein